MGGGPSQIDTFDMKPDAPAEYRGEFASIPTSVPGIRVCEHLPRVAKLMDKLVLLRNMSTGEADHVRGSYFLQTGHPPLPGTRHPLLGSVASAELDRSGEGLPNFFWLGSSPTADAGFLGARHGPIRISEIHEEAARNLECVKAPTEPEPFGRQLGLLDELEARFQKEHHGSRLVADHRATYSSAVRLMRSSKLSALDLFREPKKTREAYGEKAFGKGALLARRLVEVGVPFVGVGFGDWDTHNDNWARMRPNLEQVDVGMSALLRDLDERGLLATTLVVWMGEFGRAPRIDKSPKPGRDHFARAWTTVLAGAGVKAGQAVGSTGKLGMEVEGRPTRTVDFMATLCQALGIDYTKKNTTPDGRPIGIAGDGARPVPEVVG
jgi:hypothetical protein